MGSRRAHRARRWTERREVRWRPPSRATPFLRDGWRRSSPSSPASSALAALVSAVPLGDAPRRAAAAAGGVLDDGGARRRSATPARSCRPGGGRRRRSSRPPASPSRSCSAGGSARRWWCRRWRWSSPAGGCGTPPWRTAFNVGQYACALAAAYAVIRLGPGSDLLRRAVCAGPTWPRVGGATPAWFVVNYGLVSRRGAAALRRPLVARRPAGPRLRTALHRLAAAARPGAGRRRPGQRRADPAGAGAAVRRLPDGPAHRRAGAARRRSTR